MGECTFITNWNIDTVTVTVNNVIDSKQIFNIFFGVSKCKESFIELYTSLFKYFTNAAIRSDLGDSNIILYSMLKLYPHMNLYLHNNNIYLNYL